MKKLNMKGKAFVLSLLMLGSALPALAGTYSPMPSKHCLKSPACMQGFNEEMEAIRNGLDWPPRPEISAEPEKTSTTRTTSVPIEEHRIPEAKKCVEKPGGWSELEYYEMNAWWFRTWGKLMTVEERDTWRCGWPV